MKKLNYGRITATIEREWLAEIIAGTKKIEYRQIKPYWTKRCKKVSLPFELRLLNGMNPPVPRGHCPDPQDHPACGRVPIAHQEGFELQALGQAAAETETVILHAQNLPDSSASPSAFFACNSLNPTLRTALAGFHVSDIVVIPVPTFERRRFARHAK